MGSELNAKIAELKSKAEDKAAVVAREREAKALLVENAYKLRSLETHLDALREQLEKLDGFSVDNIVYSILGRKQQQVASYEEQLDAFSLQHEECEQAVDRLEAEVANLDKQLRSYGNVEAEYEALLASKQEALAGSEQNAETLRELTNNVDAATGVVNRIAKAAEAIEELMRDIRDEVETLSTLGRCRVAEGHKAISAIVNAGRDKTAKLIADHIRQGLRRFNRRFAEALDNGDVDDDGTLGDLASLLEQYTQRFDVQWFYNPQDAEESTSNVYDKLYLADSLIDKQLGLAKERLREIEAKRREFLESA